MGDLSPNFDRSEFRCKCGACRCDTVDAALLDVLEDVRQYFNAPVKINSGHRCKEHNRAVGGSVNSQHLYGRAADIVVKGVSAYDVQEYLEGKYPDSFGLGGYDSFTHIDTRGDFARWYEE